MDLNKELEVLKSYKGSEFFKPKQGKYKVVFVGEPLEDQYIDKDTGEKKEQILFQIQYNKEFYNWSISKGKSCNSLWGQLLLVAEVNGLKFNGMVATIVVQGEGSKVRYTVLEALDLIQDNEDDSKAVK